MGTLILFCGLRSVSVVKRFEAHIEARSFPYKTSYKRSLQASAPVGWGPSAPHGSTLGGGGSRGSRDHSRPPADEPALIAKQLPAHRTGLPAGAPPGRLVRMPGQTLRGQSPGPLSRDSGQRGHVSAPDTPHELTTSSGRPQLGLSPRIPVELIHRGGGPGSARRAPGGQVSWVWPPGRACVCRAGRGDEGQDPLPTPPLAPQSGGHALLLGGRCRGCSSPS